MASQDTTFSISGNVGLWGGGIPPVNTVVDLRCVYHYIEEGVSVGGVSVLLAATDAFGNYVRALHLPTWDSGTPFGVTVTAQDTTNWSTTTIGVYNQTPTGTSPIQIPVSQTVILHR